jgi:hypothetical protein
LISQQFFNGIMLSGQDFPVNPVTTLRAPAVRAARILVRSVQISMPK